MRYALLLFVLLHGFVATATQDSYPGVKLVHKRFRFGNCKCYSNWLEVQSYNKTATDSINSTIRRELQAFRYFPDSAQCCGPWNHNDIYERMHGVKMQTSLILSFLYTQSGHTDGTKMPRLDILTLNFNPQTGQRLRISQAVYAHKKASLDSIILQRLAMAYGCEVEALPGWLTSQLTEPEFVIENYGITLLFTNENGFHFQQPWTYKELRCYMQTEILGDLRYD
ncbi:hypothetical protein [Polluticoccus soli]|uniref:hypothetical protein n=1 Tax=Polluticoccus soli TaxID=3034150 RepID=UPI0023E11AAF|nr:hypothetical protein [Flavipsychrobacter sp. JY13-12]